MKNLLLIIFLLSLFNTANSQEKGSILMGVTSLNNEVVNLESIKHNIINTYSAAIKKIELCTNHSLIHIVLNTNSKPYPSASDILNYLISNFPNYQFFDKIIHENFSSLNCKWQ